jgi:hypothetical protein
MNLPPLDINLTTYYVTSAIWEMVDDAAVAAPAANTGECGDAGTGGPAPQDAQPTDPANAPVKQHRVLVGYTYQPLFMLLPSDSPLSWVHRDDSDANSRSSNDNEHRHRPAHVVPPEPAPPVQHAGDPATGTDQDPLR